MDFPCILYGVVNIKGPNNPDHGKTKISRYTMSHSKKNVDIQSMVISV
jgi:hypothetical protein